MTRFPTLRNLLLSSPRKARDAALERYKAVHPRDTRGRHAALPPLQNAQTRLLKAERRWGWVRV
jgi:hypothetical protein